MAFGNGYPQGGRDLAGRSVVEIGCPPGDPGRLVAACQLSESRGVLSLSSPGLCGQTGAARNFFE